VAALTEFQRQQAEPPTPCGALMPFLVWLSVDIERLATEIAELGRRLKMDSHNF